MSGSRARAALDLGAPARTLLGVALCVLLGYGPGAGSARAGQENGLSLDAIFASSAPTAPSMMRWSPDGATLAYLWKDGEGKALWLDSFDGRPPRRVLAVDAQDASREREPPALAELDGARWSPDGDALLLSAGGDLYLLELAASSELERPPRLRRLTETDSEEKLPRFSPDGARIAFVRDQDLHLIERASGRESRLTEDGRKNQILNGITDWVYWEELWNRRQSGYWWSPDGSRIAYYRFDETAVESYPMVDFVSGEPLAYPTVEWQKYPIAGTTNPAVRVGVLELASGRTVWLETGADPDVYLPRVDWLPAGDAVAVQRLTREQDRLDLLRCDPATGACAPLLEERAESWINVSDDLHFLDDGGFLWSSERSGWRRLALHDAAGRELGTLSPEGWAVTGVDGVADDGSAVFYTAYPTGELGALHRVGFRQALPDGAPVALTEAAAWSRVLPAPDGARLVHWQSDARTPTRIVVRDRAGGELAELPTAGKPGIDAAALPRPRFLTLPGPGGARFPAALLTPPELDPERRYPALMYHYGCPASQVVADRWSWRERALWHALMAERGFVVLMVDNLASNFFGKRGEDRAHRRFGPGNLAAQEGGVDYLESLGYVDPERIGIWGGSGGGANTLYALLESPGTWRAGVAFAPVTDWRLYDTIWTERYLDHPDDNPEGYRLSSPLTYAKQLRDRLLLVHGTADDNVHPQNTLAMAHALVRAGKPFEMAIHPRQKHAFRGADLEHFYRRMTEFFERHLTAKPDSPD